MIRKHYWRWQTKKQQRRIKDVLPDALSPEHLHNCFVVPDRFALLDHLPKGSVVAEVGVLFGEFSDAILERTQPSQLHLIDIANKWGDRFDDQGSRVISHIGDSADTLAQFADEYFDWIYIDADHRYAGVKRDAQVAMKKVKANGRLVFNDYSIFDPNLGAAYGVAKAIHELCINDGWQMTCLALHRYGLFDVVLQRTSRENCTCNDDQQIPQSINADG